MKYKYLENLALGLLTATSLSAASADITLPDTLPGTAFAGNNGSDGEWSEVEPGALAGSEWDFRGFDIVEVFQGVTYVFTAFGGYDFDDGVVGPGRSGGVATTEPLTLGDIFIDINGNAIFGAAAPTYATGSGGNPPVGNSNYRYDAVIHFDQSDLTGNPGSVDYQVLTLAEDDTVQVLRTTDYGGTFNDKAGPYRYASGGVLLDSGTATVVDYAAGGPPSGGIDGSGLAGNRLSLTIDGAFLTYLLTATSGIITHLTQECGNDLLMGGPVVRARQVNVTPDGGTTLILLGLGLGGLAFARAGLSRV